MSEWKRIISIMKAPVLKRVLGVSVGRTLDSCIPITASIWGLLLPPASSSTTSSSSSKNTTEELLLWATLVHLSSVGKSKREPQQPKASVTAAAAPCNYRFHTLLPLSLLGKYCSVVDSTGGPVWILNCAECKYCTTKQQRGGNASGRAV